MSNRGGSSSSGSGASGSRDSDNDVGITRNALQEMLMQQNRAAMSMRVSTNQAPTAKVEGVNILSLGKVKEDEITFFENNMVQEVAATSHLVAMNVGIGWSAVVEAGGEID